MAGATAGFAQAMVLLFDGENYDFWKIKMKTLLRSQNLWSIVDAGFIDPESEANLTNNQKEKLNENRMKDAKALLFIQQGVADTIFPRIIGATNAKDAWEILEKEFQGDSKVTSIKLQSLRRELENLKMKESESLKNYFSRVMGIVNQMRSYGENISDQKIVEKILISLPEKYEYVVTVIEEVKDLKTLSVQELMSSLLAHEQRKSWHDDKSIESAFQTRLTLGSQNKKNSSFHKKGMGRNSFEKNEFFENSTTLCEICKKPNHATSDCWFRGKKQCYNCKRFGHIAKYCRFQKNDHANFLENKEGEENEKEETLFYACQFAAQGTENTWYLDSGCSNHMTGNQKLFVHLEDNFNSHVKLANGSLQSIKGKGIVAVQTKGGKKRFIHDVLYIPGLTQNLLSVGQLMQKGYSVIFDNEECIIVDKKNNSVVAKIKMTTSRAFPLVMPIEEQELLGENLIEQGRSSSQNSNAMIKQEFTNLKGQEQENKIVETCGVAFFAYNVPCKKTSNFMKRQFQGARESSSIQGGGKEIQLKVVDQNVQQIILKREFGIMETKGNFKLRGGVGNII